MQFSQSDQEQITAHGLTEQEIERQLEMFRNPPQPLAIDRPCIPGDGILQLPGDEEQALAELFDQGAAEGRLARFVPASGAASRMFKELFNSTEALAEWQKDGRCPNHPFHQQFFSGLKDFPFIDDLAMVLKETRGLELDQLIATRNLEPVLAALLESWGLNYAARPKGLLAFHAYPDGVRTPLEEHLCEAISLTGDAPTPVRLHFTVSPEYLEDFRHTAARATEAFADRLNAGAAFAFSCQQPSTDTLAVAPDNTPLRDDKGRLLFRPAGHGALIGNLADTGGDILLVKNIDNVVPEPMQPEVVRWWKLLGGKLLETQKRVHALLYDLEAPENETACDMAEALLGEFGLETTGTGKAGNGTGRAQVLHSLLMRPIRVCGMVRNTGEPGGGPFWVRGDEGTTPQIVERAQIPDEDPAAMAALNAATHFNPVLMACALRDHRGKPYDLQDYIDRDAVIITAKSDKGKDLKALERPGLWNGAMAGWLTLFVEVPESIFQPVKTVNDLLRPGHLLNRN